MNNPIYWIMNPLDSEEISVLKSVKNGHQAFFGNRFTVAYLISLKCVEPDYKNHNLNITEKGEDALLFFKD